MAIVCSYKDGHWIGVAPLGGGETRILHRVLKPVGMRGFSGLAWTGDGRAILFQTMDSESSDSLWRVALDGSPAERLLATTGIISSISASPNGRDIAFATFETRRELWVMEGLKVK